jgi:N-formylglutamate amidohydrolase
MPDPMPPLRLHPARAEPVPLVFDSPHSGSWFPADFGHCLTEHELRSGEDCHIHELYAPAPAHGAVLLEATFARTYLDVNRSESDIDPELIDGQWPHPVADSGKGRFGQALVWRNLSDGRPIYARKLTVAEMAHRIENFLRPYHRQLRGLIDEAHARHGVVYHVNCHSMQSVGGKMSQDGEGARRADIVLGDRDGTSCSAEFTALVRDVFADAGYEVRVNDPYKGVELVRAFSAPQAGRHSLQIEINRALYMDERTLEKNDGFERLRADVARLIERVAAYARDQAVR